VSENTARPSKWPDQVFRRLLVDTHVPDWDPVFLSRLDPVEYVDCIARAGFQSLMQYTNSCVGVCLWRTEVGQMHANLKGRDLFCEIISECRRRGLHTVAYFIVNWDNWPSEKHPAWRILPAEGDDHILQGRYGLVCPKVSNPTRALRETPGTAPHLSREEDAQGNVW